MSEHLFIRDLRRHRDGEVRLYDPTGRLISGTMVAQILDDLPKPPKPDEPTGLGAVVEDADGMLWIRVQWTNPWCSATPSGDVRGSHGAHRRWADLDATRVLSEGVPAC